MDIIVEVNKLTINEIKSMLLATIKKDAYHAKCFLNLLLEKRENTKEEHNIFKEILKLISQNKLEFAIQKIKML